MDRNRSRCRRKSAWVSFIALLALVVSFSLAGRSSKPDDPTAGLDLTTPEATITAWYQAISAGDIRLQKALAQADSSSMRTAIEGSERLAKARITYQVSDLEMRLLSNDGNRAKYQVKYNFQTISKRSKSEVQVGGALVSLIKIGNRWYIIRVGDDLDE